MSKISKTIVATAVFFATGSIITTAVIADAPAAVDSSKLKTGLTPLAQLLQLMDTDKNGKVSKDEFMKFMETEFDYADRSKDGQLDPAELKNLVFKMNHPYTGRSREGNTK
jgi:Ca2+-binding EF-hand superfamily protein